MDNKDIYGIGSDIKDAVDDAVKSGDFSGLNDALKKTVRDVTGSAAGTAADALYNFQGYMQGTSGSKDGDNGGGQGRSYGHAGYSSENMTEQYRQRAAGARHHTTFSSKVTPFLQRKISRASGTGRIVGGIFLLVMAGFSFVDSLFCLVDCFFCRTLSTGFHTVRSVLGFVMLLGFYGMFRFVFRLNIRLFHTAGGNPSFIKSSDRAFCRISCLNISQIIASFQKNVKKNSDWISPIRALIVYLVV